MVGTHPAKHSFSIGQNISSYTLIFKWPGHIRLNPPKRWPFSLHTRFQNVVTHPVIHRFNMVVTHSVTHSFSNGWDTLGYILIFECSRHTRIHTHFQVVVAHPVSHSFSDGRDTSASTLVFKWSGHTQLQTRFRMLGKPPVTHSFSNCCYRPRCKLVLKGRFTPSYTLVFKLLINTWLHTHFQMVGKHARGYNSFPNGRDTSGYTLPLFVRDTQLHTRFQIVATHNVTHSF